MNEHTITAIARNPRTEATELLADGYEARVLEPSPPANTDPDWYADDPTDPSGAAGIVVSPVPGGDLTWTEYSRSHPEVAPYAAEHWLGAWKPLAELPEGYAATRDSLHQIAFFAVAPTRYRANGKLGLRWTHRGFGTPFFGKDHQVRVEGTTIVHQSPDGVRTAPVTTVAGACAFLDTPYESEWFPDFHDPLRPMAPEKPLEISEEASWALADWFGFATSVLEELRRIPGGVDVGRVQLWPEHFDPAVELGSAEEGRRASYGASPGDAGHPDPYLYVSPWGDVDDDPYWNAEGFGGAVLGYDRLVGVPDAREKALEFLARGHRLLNS